MSKMSKINKWITLFFATMVLNIFITYSFTVGTNFYADIFRIIVNVLNGVSGIYILFKVSQRDEIIKGNTTIMDLIYYKEHSKKQKNFPLSPTLMLVYSITMIAYIGYLCLVFYYKFIMKG